MSILHFSYEQFIVAPAFYIFGPSGKVKKEDKFEVQKYGYQAETLATWVEDRTGLKIRIYRPPNYSSVGFLLLITCSIAAILYMKWSRVNNLFNRETISWVSLQGGTYLRTTKDRKFHFCQNTKNRLVVFLGPLKKFCNFFFG